MGFPPTCYRLQFLLSERKDSPQSFGCLPGHCCCLCLATTRLAWDFGFLEIFNRTRKKEGKKGRRKEGREETRGSSPFFQYYRGPHFSLLRQGRESFSWSSCSLYWVHSPGIWVAFQSRLGDEEENKQTPEIHHHIAHYSSSCSSIFLLPFTFQSLQITSLCILSWFLVAFSRGSPDKIQDILHHFLV